MGKIRYKQGKFFPTHPEKWKGDIKNIIYRSGLELDVFDYCDRNSYVLEIASEEFFIPYTSVDGKRHRYFPDLWVKIKNRKGEIKEFIIEIKPFDQCRPPKPQKRITYQYKERIKTYLINKCKWDAAEKFAEKNNAKFIHITEKDVKYTKHKRK